MTTFQPDGYLALPTESNGSGVLVLHAWWGLNSTIRGLCDQMANAGYTTFAPDLYHGETANTIASAEALSEALTAKGDLVKAEVAEAARYLARLVGEGTDDLAVIGFSLGAAYALDLSATAPELIRKVILFYGTGDGDFSKARAAYQGHFADNDPYEPEDNVNWLEKALRDAGRTVTFHRYAGAGHWFFEPDIPDAYNADATELAWQRMMAFLRE